MAITLDLSAALDLNDSQFAAICQRNRGLRLELSANGELVIMPPTGGDTGARNADLNGQLWLWNRQTQLGQVFDSSTGFRLPDGSVRSPDAAWVAAARWQALTPAQRQGFIPLCPDFVVELQSATDDGRELQAKLHSYLDNGLRLGWLIDPKTQTVDIYRPQQAVMRLAAPRQVMGDPVLPGFVLDLGALFTA